MFISRQNFLICDLRAKSPQITRFLTLSGNTVVVAWLCEKSYIFRHTLDASCPRELQLIFGHSEGCWIFLIVNKSNVKKPIKR